MNNDKLLTPPQVTLPSGKIIQRKLFSQYSIEELSDIISECDNFSHIIRIMKINSVYHNKIKKIVENNNISTSHFKIQYKRTASNDSEIRSKTTFKRKLLNEGKLINKCAICNMEPIWNNKPITLPVQNSLYLFSFKLYLCHQNIDHFNLKLLPFNHLLLNFPLKYDHIIKIDLFIRNLI